MVSIAVSLVNTAFVMPVDFIKTHFQKFKGSEKPSFKEIVGNRYMEVGLRGFYIGWQVKLIQYTINSMFTVAILERHLNDYLKLA